MFTSHLEQIKETQLSLNSVTFAIVMAIFMGLGHSFKCAGKAVLSDAMECVRLQSGTNVGFVHVIRATFT
jgi:hypothetical protein